MRVLGERALDRRPLNRVILSKYLYGSRRLVKLACGDVRHRHTGLIACDLDEEQTIALGSPARRVEHLRALEDVGVDECALYGSTPAQNAGLIAAWRDGA